VKDPGAKKKEWLQFRLQASSGFVGLPNRLVDSPAFAALTTGASVKCLVWFWQMANYGRQARTPGTESPIGRVDKITNNGELSFTYQEAEWRGVSPSRFRCALKDLYRLGFIEVEHLGRGQRCDFTKYALSNRWQKYSTQEWEETPFPKNFSKGCGFRDERYIEKKRREKVEKNNVRKRTLETTRNVKSQRSKTNVSIDLAMPTGSKKESKKRSSAPDTGSKDAAAPIRKQLPFVKPKVLPCQLSPEQIADFLREVGNVGSWT
jgi:hypothetical protein